MSDLDFVSAVPPFPPLQGGDVRVQASEHWEVIGALGEATGMELGHRGPGVGIPSGQFLSVVAGARARGPRASAVSGSRAKPLAPGSGWSRSSRERGEAGRGPQPAVGGASPSSSVPWVVWGGDLWPQEAVSVPAPEAVAAEPPPPQAHLPLLPLPPLPRVS